MLATAIKRARHLALLPFVSDAVKWFKKIHWSKNEVNFKRRLW
jgi:hypothetical protein